MEKVSYKVQNWKAYNKSLISRGSITLWICEDLSEKWYNLELSGKKGRSNTYSDEAIELCLIIRSLYKFPLRFTQGYLQSLFDLLNLVLKVPDYSRMSRRGSSLRIKTREKFKDGNIDIVWDSTGLKVYGEGEWKVKKHGVGKRRTWRKLHLGCDPLTQEIIAFKLTGNEVSDDEVFPELLESVEEEVDYNYGDGAYDRKRCYDSCYKKGSTLIVPPRKDAKKSSGNDPTKSSRDRAIERIESLGGDEEARKQWKEKVDYHTRSLAETAMFRIKTTCGDRLKSRNFDNQVTEAAIKIKILNQFTKIGMPDSYPCAT